MDVPMLDRIMVAVIALGATGCATVPPGARSAAEAAGYGYAAGRGTQSFSGSPASVLTAVRDSLGDLNVEQVTYVRDGTVTRMEGKTADKRAVVVTVRSSKGGSHVASRVGWFGDDAFSQSLLERVGVRLGSRPPEAISATAPSNPSRNPYFSREAISNEEMLRDFAEAPFRDRVIP